MNTLNNKNVIFSGFFSLKAGDHVDIAPPALTGRLFRFMAAEATGAGPSPSNIKFVNNQMWLPIPLLEFGNNSLELDPIYTEGSDTISGRVILQGAGKLTLVFVELYLHTRP